MKPRTISIAAAALASGLLFSISQIAGVQADDRHKRGCSNKTLKGSYGNFRTETARQGHWPPSAITPSTETETLVGSGTPAEMELILLMWKLSVRMR